MLHFAYKPQVDEVFSALQRRTFRNGGGKADKWTVRVII